MPRKRDRASNLGLLPLMEARQRKDGGYTYRYHPAGGKPINLGHDRDAALQKVLDMNQTNPDRGNVHELWRLYQDSRAWAKLSQHTRNDYEQCSIHLLRVFGEAQAWQIKPSDVARYLRVERADSPVRANREKALLSNLMNLALERGDIEANPCKQVRRNEEQPRTHAPEADVIARFMAWVSRQTPQQQIIGMMAEYASLAGSRGIEFLDLAWPQVDEVAGVVRVKRAKQRGGKRGEVIDLIEITPPLAQLLSRLRAVRDDRGVDCLYVFPNKHNNQYTSSGLKAMWNKTRASAIVAGAIQESEKFTFHDLRAFYATQFKRQTGALPDLHANPATTARIYDRNKEIARRALK